VLEHGTFVEAAVLMHSHIPVLRVPPGGARPAKSGALWSAWQINEGSANGSGKVFFWKTFFFFGEMDFFFS